MSNVISLRARKNTSGLSDEQEASLATECAAAWRDICQERGFAHVEPALGGHVVLPHGNYEYEIHLPLKNGDVTYFVTLDGLGPPGCQLKLRYMGRETAE